MHVWRFRFACLAACCSISWLVPGASWAQDTSGKDVTVEVGAKQASKFPRYSLFAQKWQDDQWIPREARRFPQHIRDQADKGWQLRMLALHEVVSAGEDAVPFLLERLESGEAHERILAAQALGFLARHAPAEPLLKALQDDTNTAVQLYAVDALGMRGDGQLAERFANVADEIRNRDVRKHISYAEQRKGVAIDEAIVQKLAAWKPDNLNSARLGKPAPDFELATVGGKQKIKLSDYRGKKSVVLVFIYGDT